MDTMTVKMDAPLGAAEDSLMEARAALLEYRAEAMAADRPTDWEVERMTSEIGWLETVAGKLADYRDEIAQREAGR